MLAHSVHTMHTSIPSLLLELAGTRSKRILVQRAAFAHAVELLVGVLVADLGLGQLCLLLVGGP